MEYGGGMGGGDLGSIVGGLGLGGLGIAQLPNTGGSLRVLTIVAFVSIIVGLMVILSTLARMFTVHKITR